MVINPPLIVVSALFFLALSSVLYVAAWGVASVVLRIARNRISNTGAKRVLMTALTLPPLLAVILTIGGATFKHSHAGLTEEHDGMLCERLYGRFLEMTSVHGNIVAGLVVNGIAWIAIGAAAFSVIRLFWATAGLERGLTPFLEAPSPKLVQALSHVAERIPGLRIDQFYECAIPPAYSSVLGLRRIRCVLSREFVQNAGDDDLRVVVAHEAAHLRAGDTWATLFVGALNCLFFPIRPVRLLSRRWHEAAELACDDAAVAVTNDPIGVASAILRVNGIAVQRTDHIRPLPATTLSFANEMACAPSVRVERLIAHAQMPLPSIEGSTPSAAGGWVLTLMLASLGFALLVSPESVCFAHCTLEAVAKILS